MEGKKKDAGTGVTIALDRGRPRGQGKPWGKEAIEHKNNEAPEHCPLSPKAWGGKGLETRGGKQNKKRDPGSWGAGGMKNAVKPQGIGAWTNSWLL